MQQLRKKREITELKREGGRYSDSDEIVISVVTYVLVEVNAVLFRLSRWHVHCLVFFLVSDALDKIGERGRSGLHIILFGSHLVVAFAFYSSFRAFGH